MIFNIADKEGIRRSKERLDLLIERAKNKNTYEIDLKAIHKKRTNDQNSYLHLAITLYGIETGYTCEEAKILIKRELGYTYTKNNIVFLCQTSKMNTKELTDFIDRFRNWSAKQNIYIPAPGENLSELINYIELNKQWT